MEPCEAGVVILAAGMSERMKEMKVFLPYNANTTFIEKILASYSDWGCREIVVVTNPEAFQRMNQTKAVSSSIKIVITDQVAFERFYSVKLGLQAIIRSSFCFIQNVDNPFIDGSILDLIYQSRSDKKYVSPVYENKGGHPVLLNSKNINQIRNWPVNSANFKEVLRTMECTKIEMKNDRVLININSQKEYRTFFMNQN